MAFHNIAPPGITASVAPTNRDKNHTLLAPVHPNSSGIDARRASSLTYSSECSILSGVVGFVNGIAPMGGVACDADGGPDCVAVGGYGIADVVVMDALQIRIFVDAGREPGSVKAIPDHIPHSSVEAAQIDDTFIAFAAMDGRLSLPRT